MPHSFDAARLLTGTPDAFLAASRADMDRARAEIARLKRMAEPREQLAALRAYDAATGALDDAAARASVCRNAHPDARMRETGDTCEQELEALKTELSLDRAVYDALSALDVSGLDGATRHFVTRVLRNFRRAGVDKDEATRARVTALNEELVRIGQEFGKNIRDDVRTLEVEPAALDGLPEDYRQGHPVGPNGKVTITTDNPDYIPFLTYSKNAQAREAIWKLYRRRAYPHNEPVLKRMLERRRELANLLGYPTWAAYATEDKMIRTEQAAADFIAKVVSISGSRQARDYQQLLARKRKDEPSATEVPGWDSAYYQERVKAEEYGFDAQSIRPYLEYNRVKQGVLDVTGRIFGIEYRRAADGAAWHPDVEAYDVWEQERLLGRIYLDMHPREGKYKHYAQFTVSKGVEGVQLPEGALLCNFPRPSGAPGAAPALLEHHQAETFFHEFGHLLHHVFGGHVRWSGLSGVETEWDFVEAPSQMLEEWCWDAEALATFARHVDSGQPIPAELVKQAKAADEYGKGLFVRQQMLYAALSLELHRREPHALDVGKLVKELQEHYTPFHFVDGTHFEVSFGHLDGYSAIYYTYMWSLVIAKDLFSVFLAEGVLNPAPARRYRRAVLDQGGAKPAAELVKDFLGRPYDFRAYEAWLNAA